MTRWEKVGASLTAILAIFGVSNVSDAALVTFEVIPAFAPKGPESPSWEGYVQNALVGIQMGQNVGDREISAAAYQRVEGMVSASEVIYTPFPSWRGKANPNPDFSTPFLGEFGNRIHFGLHVVATADRPFRLSDLSWALDSDDSTGYFDQARRLSGSCLLSHTGRYRLGSRR